MPNQYGQTDPTNPAGAIDPNTGQFLNSEGPGGFTGQAQKGGPQPLANQNPSGTTADQVNQWYKQYLGRAPENQLAIDQWMTADPTAAENGIKVSDEAKAYAAKQGTQVVPPTPSQPVPSVGAAPSVVNSDTSNLTGSSQSQALIDQLMKRANQSLSIDPNTDPTIRPQVDNYAATQERASRKAIDQQAEAGNPYATGALQNERTQATEAAGQNTANLQSQLTQNELTSRRQEIQNALVQAGGLLTQQQQLSLQQELGLLDSALRQQQVNSGNDQFLATLGLNSENQNNYWQWLRSGGM